MRDFGCRTIRVLVSAIVLLATLPAWGQGENPPASTKESGATSGYGMTMVEQTYKEAVAEQIRALHQERWQAALKNDAAFFEKGLASQYFGVGADGRLRTKLETIQSFQSGEIKYQAVDERNVTVDTCGDAAIVNSTAFVKATIQGRPIDGDYRATFVYVREGKGWREVAFQLTPA